MTAPAFSLAPTRTAGIAMAGMMIPRRRGACAVSLIDRRTGRPHRINGRPLVLFTRQPEEAAAELLEGRDAAVWDVQVEAIGQGGER